MKKLTIIITDGGFLVPSVALADSIAKSELGELTDVIVYLVDIDDVLRKELTESRLSHSMEFFSLHSERIGLAQNITFKDGHVPITSLYRLSIYPYLPTSYRDIIYLDGDILIAGDAKPLFDYTAPEGKIAAAAENFVALENEYSSLEWLQGYLAALGLERCDQYFNGGVLAFQRETWKTVGPQALAYFNANSKICWHHDQSAMNGALRGQWCPISPAYNFHTYFYPIHQKITLSPKVLHFSSSPKPWQSFAGIWPPKYAEPYRALVSEFPFLARYLALYPRKAFGGAALHYARELKHRVGHWKEIDRRGKALQSYIERTEFVVR